MGMLTRTKDGKMRLVRAEWKVWALSEWKCSLCLSRDSSAIMGCRPVGRVVEGIGSGKG